MSKKQFLLTLLALITLIVNLEVRANSLIVAQPEERLPLKPCKLPAVKEAVLCGNYEVWENRESLKGRKISLYVVVAPALNPNPAPDPLFAISGGPGQAATEVFLNGFAEIRKNRDIVLVDQRGTGRSNSLACDAANLQELVQIIVGEDAPREGIRRCRAQLEQKADLRMYTTATAVEDLDEVRKWLGYKTINLYGGSYGSRVALVYLRRFPQNVRTVTLRAVYPTTIPVPLYAPRYNQRSLDRLLDDCARDEKCRQSFPDLKQDFQTALDLLTSSPANITVTDPRANKPVELAITRGVFAGVIRQLLLDSNSQRFIPVIVRGAAKGDYAPLKTLIGQALRTIGGINFGMNTSVICSEEIPRIRPADIKRESTGAFLTGSVVQTRIDLCREWPRGRAPANYFEPVKSDSPVLLISGELDPATPFEWGDEAARHLPNSLHIIQPGVAHGPFTPCAQNVMNRFVEAGTTTGLDATCVKDLKRPAFLTPPPSQQQQNESSLQSAIRQFGAKQYPEPKAALEQLVVREPNNATAGTLAQQKTETAFTPAQLEELLDRLSAHTESYKETFKDLTAQERRTFELLAPDGTVLKQNRLVAELIVYPSQRNANRATEFRNIREVDGQRVEKRDVRLEKLFERLKKDDSADKELGRIIKESTRYDFGYQLSGYMFYKAMATWKILRPLFEYEAPGRERVGERELLAIRFEQKQFRKDMFGLDQIFDPALFTGPMMRGAYWVDPDTAQIWREHHEIFFRNNQSAETYKVVEVDFDFASSKFEVFLPRRVMLQHFKLLKTKKGEPLRMYRSAKVVSDLSDFQRFNTEGKQEGAPRP
jgi:pimeloyl-ACP methyl ester carboxylesterase